MESVRKNDRFQKAALVVAGLGAVLSVALMLASGLRPPVLLIFLFVLWVTAPFVAVGLIAYFFRRREGAGSVLVWTATLSTFSSLAVYTYVLVRPLASQAAFPYVLLPPLQVIGIILVSGFLVRRVKGM